MGEIVQDRIARYVAKIEAERETMMEVAERVAEGEGVAALCKAWDIPSGRFMAWLTADPRRMSIYEGARRIRADRLADETLEIADGEDEPPQKSVRIKARQWAAAKWDRDKYGEAVDVRVAVVDVRGALEEARGRLVATVPAVEIEGGGEI